MIVWTVCHRVWPISLNAPVGRCGGCGEKPTGLFYSEEEAKAELVLRSSQ